MEKVEKALMFVWRDNNGEREFFAIHRKQGDFVIPTGHLEAGETPEQAAVREVEEEFGVKPIGVTPTGYSYEVELPEVNKHSTEYAFLLQIPNQPVKFLEHNETGDWHTFSELSELLSYSGQRSALPHIAALL